MARQALRADPPARPDEAGARRATTQVLEEAGLRADDVDYVATTGEGENVKFPTGHFYSMTTHARGGIFLRPEARAVLDIGALHGRAIYVDERGKVLAYKMTSQCASGSGQFLENIARYLGVAQRRDRRRCRSSADNPEKVQLDLRRAGRDRRHQHGVARHRRAGHPQGHPPVDGRAPRQAAEGHRHQTGHGADDRRPGAGPGLVAAMQEEMVKEKVTVDGDQPPGLDLCRRHRRGLVGRVPPRAAAANWRTRRGSETAARTGERTWH